MLTKSPRKIQQHLPTEVKLVVELTEEDWDRVFAVNARGVFLCDQAAAKQMIKQKSGKIINCASIAGHSGFNMLAHWLNQNRRLGPQNMANYS